jgi:hypothetical protein
MCNAFDVKVYNVQKKNRISELHYECVCETTGPERYSFVARSEHSEPDPTLQTQLKKHKQAVFWCNSN